MHVMKLGWVIETHDVYECSLKVAIAYTSSMSIIVEDYSAGRRERNGLFKCFRWDIGHDISIPVF